MKPVQAAAYSEGFEAGKMFVGMQKDDELSRLQAELEEAREIIGMLLNPPSPNSPEPHAYAKYADMTFRARAFLDKAGK
jgi:hypothetical protein